VGHALELGSGGGVVSYGDDRALPCLHSWMQTSFGLLLGITNSGEKNSSFAQQTAFAHISYATNLPRSRTLEANLGLGGIIFRTTIKQTPPEGSESTALSRSAGFALGLRWKPALGKNLRARVSWDGLYVPPGYSAVYLAFGHAQAISAGLGWDF
jgi:hypothetical protein